MFFSIFQVYLIFILGLISPGQDFLIVLSISVKSGRLAGCFVAAGIASGIVFWIGLSVFIIESLSDGYLEILLIGKLCLAVGLIYIGSKTISSSLRSSSLIANNKLLSLDFNPYFLGLAVNLTNPKAAVFTIGLSSMLQASIESSLALFMVVCGIPLLTLAWFISVAFFFSNSFFTVIVNENRRKISFLLGIALIFLGILLIISVGIS